jgi:hypothetical protein
VELGEFVTEAPVQLVKGIHNANKALASDAEKGMQPFLLHHSLGDRPQAPHVEFDVAVTTQLSATGDAKGAAKLYVATFEMNGSGSISKESVSRVKFSVLVKQSQG